MEVSFKRDVTEYGDEFVNNTACGHLKVRVTAGGHIGAGKNGRQKRSGRERGRKTGRGKTRARGRLREKKSEGEREKGRRERKKDREQSGQTKQDRLRESDKQ